MKRSQTLLKIIGIIFLFFGIIGYTQDSFATNYKVGDLTTSDTLTVYGVFRVGGDLTTTTTFSTIDSSQMTISNIILTTDSTYTRLNADSLVAKEYFTVGDTTTGDHDATVYFADDASYTAEYIRWDDGNSSFEVSDDITPISDQNSNLGSSAKKFNHIYTDSIHATVFLGNSPFYLGVPGEVVTIRSDTLIIEGALVVKGKEIDLKGLSRDVENLFKRKKAYEIKEWMLLTFGMWLAALTVAYWKKSKKKEN